MTELTDAAKKAQAAYMRLWRLKNPDKQRAIRMAYWERKGQQMQKTVTEPELLKVAN